MTEMIEPCWEGHGQRLYFTDALTLLASLPDESVDAVVTDPPYNLEFMGQEWDSFKPAKGKWGDREHQRTLVTEDDTPQHRAAVHQPAVLKRCGNCGGNSSGQWNRCQCPSPDFRAPLWPLHAFQAWCAEWAAEVYRVLKPGGHLVAFGGTRTYHRLGCAVEDAGLEVRDSIHWLYGQGFLLPQEPGRGQGHRQSGIDTKRH
jgi:site-specific DNA-methyltransferase (adenine-specific)